MHVMAGDRGDVDDRSLALRQSRGKGASQGQRHEEVQLKHSLPIFEVAVENAEPFLGRSLWRDAGIVDERMQRAVEKLPRLGNEVLEVVRIGKIGGDMVGPVRVALAFGRHVVARTGDDPPAGIAETLDRGVPDPAAGAGQQQNLAHPAHRTATRRGKLARGSSIPSGSWWIMISAFG